MVGLNIGGYLLQKKSFHDFGWTNVEFYSYYNARERVSVHRCIG